MGQMDNRWKSILAIAEELKTSKLACIHKPASDVATCEYKNCPGRKICLAIHSCRLAIELLQDSLDEIDAGDFQMNDKLHWNGQLSSCKNLDKLLAQSSPEHHKVCRLAVQMIELFMLIAGVKGTQKAEESDAG